MIALVLMTTGFSAFKALEGLGEVAESAEAVGMVEVWVSKLK